jgi:hypothetical protein
MKLAGCISGIDLEADGVLLADVAETFLRGGGVVSFDEWRALERVERAAMIEGGNRLRREQAVLIAGAILDPSFRAKLQGDDAEALQFLEEAISRTADSIESRHAAGISEATG